MRALILLLLMWPTTLFAQGTATLVADDMALANGVLTATGNVEAFYDGTRLRAAAIRYDQGADLLTITGPIVITTPDGTVLTASQATMDPQLENGLLRSARLVLDQQLQLAAHRIDRADGNLSQLYKTAATSCQVCGSRAPLWEIRAERVVHDAAAQQLYLTNAQLRIRGVPVFWLPRMRLPDPTLDRALGFLTPSIRNNDQLGIGLKTPYFIPIGQSRDLTLTPYLSNETRTLELRYRQAFRNGDLTARAAVSRDTLRAEDTRSYLFVDGAFDLTPDTRLRFDIEAVSDTAYLLDYGYSDKDRLDSAVSITRVTDNSLIQTRLTYYESLRDDEVNAELPPIVADLAWTQRYGLGRNGQVTLGASADGLIRYGDGTGDAGRDMLRAGAFASYDQRFVTTSGLEIAPHLGLTADAYWVRDDPDSASMLTRAQPFAGLTLRYPLIARTASAQHLLEPVLALSWSDLWGDTPPNEDSTRAEFDPGNLYALTQLPGEDASQTGLRAAAGLTWTRNGSGGGASSLTFGRLYQDVPGDSFSASSGLDSRWSDWLLAGQFTLPRGLRVEGRALLDDTGDATLATARTGWRSDRFDINAAYIWQAADADRDRPEAISEWSMDGRVQISPAWAARFDTRYDLAADQPASAGLGLEWRNECVTVDVSVSRRYTSTDTVDPSTDYGLSVELIGFAAGDTAPGPKGTCRMTNGIR